MSYVKLTAKADSWFVPGEEVWSSNSRKRVSKEEFDSWGDSILVCGIHKLNPGIFCDELRLERASSRYIVDGELCPIDEFEIEFVPDDGKEQIEIVIKKYES